MLDEIKILTGLGGSGLLAVIAILLMTWYRADRQASEARIKDLAEDFRSTVRENTEALTKLQTWLEDRSRDGYCPMSGQAPLPRERERSRG